MIHYTYRYNTKAQLFEIIENFPELERATVFKTVSSEKQADSILLKLNGSLNTRFVYKNVIKNNRVH